MQGSPRATIVGVVEDPSEAADSTALRLPREIVRSGTHLQRDAFALRAEGSALEGIAQRATVIRLIAMYE
jgi:hypothetical protein